MGVGGRRGVAPLLFHVTTTPEAKQFIWQFQGDRVTVAAGIRLSTWMVQKVDTLKWKLTGLVNPDAEFDIANRSGRSRAVRWCLDIS